MTVETYFQTSIKAKGLVPAGIDARHIEGFILVGGMTTSMMSWPEIRREVKIALGCIKEGGVEEAEACARSFGL